MNIRLLDFLCCPECQGELSLEDEIKESKEILRGKLVCKCGRTYPIDRGVPRMLTNLPIGMRKVRKTFSKSNMQESKSYFENCVI